MNYVRVIDPAELNLERASSRGQFYLIHNENMLTRFTFDRNFFHITSNYRVMLLFVSLTGKGVIKVLVFEQNAIQIGWYSTASDDTSDGKVTQYLVRLRRTITCFISTQPAAIRSKCQIIHFCNPYD